MGSIVFIDHPAFGELDQEGVVRGWILNEDSASPAFSVDGQPIAPVLVDRPDVRAAYPHASTTGFEFDYAFARDIGQVEIVVGSTRRTLRYDSAPGEAVFDASQRHLDHRFGCPSDLRTSDLCLGDVIVIGSCQIEQLPGYVKLLKGSPATERYLVNQAAVLPPAMRHPPERYAFQIVQIPVGAVVPAGPWLALRGEAAEYQAFFDACLARLDLIAGNLLQWAREHRIPAFVLNFLVPQQNAMGRLLPRYDLRNPVYFFEQLNRALSDIIDRTPAAHLLDVDQLSAMSGRRYFQDDVIDNFTHGGLIADYEADVRAERLTAAPQATETYATQPDALVRAIWEESVAMYRTLRQVDSVKLVVVDLDDTLWRGVLAEENDISPDRIEGWPLGLVEALLYLRRRGVLLAILSKNDEARATKLFEDIYGRYMPLEAFTIRKINWKPKSENMQEILKEANLLPRNVVFIDDNPVERAAVRAAFPDLRVLGDNPLLCRRILLHSPETQVAKITEESSRRGEMVKAQIVREESRAKMSREDFIESLNVEVTIEAIDRLDHPRFARAFELINKTNQFNTTGRRWREGEIQALLQGGGALDVFQVCDRYTDYGLVGVVIRDGSRFEQFVMSCRVIGLDVETGVIEKLLARMPEATVEARFVATGANEVVSSLWSRTGFIEEEPGHWVRRPATRDQGSYSEMVAAK